MRVSPIDRLGRLNEQIQKVEATLSKTGDAYAKKSLQEHLSDLKSQADTLRQRIEADPVWARGEQPAAAEPVAATPLTAQQHQAMEALQRQVQVAKMRKQDTVVIDLLRQMQQIAPNSPQVEEQLGDQFVEKQAWKQALEHYTRAHQMAPTNTAIERKYAAMVLRTGSAAALEQAVLSGDTSVFISKDEVLASPKAAAILSFLVPGTGQFVRGRPTEGAWFLGAFVAALLILVLISKTLPHGNFKIYMLGGALLLVLIIMVASSASAGKKDESIHRPF